jgi:hypothetical protein
MGMRILKKMDTLGRPKKTCPLFVVMGLQQNAEKARWNYYLYGEDMPILLGLGSARQCTLHNGQGNVIPMILRSSVADSMMWKIFHAQ